MKRVLKLLAFCVALTATVMAQLPSAWQNWRYSTAAELDSVTDSQLSRVILPKQVFGHSQQSFADLRLIDDAGGETGYVVHARRGRRSRQWRQTQISDTGFVAGRYTQAVLDTGTDREPHNSLELRLREEDYMLRVELAASDDQRVWRVVRSEVPIFRFRAEGLGGSQTISYTTTSSRWLRVRLLDGEKAFTIQSGRVANEVVEEPELVALPATFEHNSDSPAKESWWQTDLGVSGVPASRLLALTSQEEFHRPVRLSVSDDGENWRTIHSGALYRFRSKTGELNSGSLRLIFNETRARYWRLVILNRNDPPLENLKIELRGTPRYVVFRQQPGKNYRLLYGNHRAEAPQYELAKLTSKEDWESAATGALSPEEVNSAYVSPDPWTERHPVVLWLALLAAVAVLGWLALRSLQQAPPTGS